MAKKGTGKKPPQKGPERKPTHTSQAPAKRVPAYKQVAAAENFIAAGADKTGGMTFNQIARTVRYDMQ